MKLPITKLEEIFGADLRSLAMLRIGMAGLILVDLFQRSQDLVAHYTDVGVLPRSAAVQVGIYNRWMWSLHFTNGTWEFQALLFLIAAVFAVGLLVGYKTRAVTIISFLLLISLDTRNLLVNQGGNMIFRAVLFWSIFLPWGARYSVDSALNPSWEKLPTRCLTWGTFAYQMQIVMMYWFTVLLKSGPEWREGTAVYYTLSLGSLSTPAGQFLLQFPNLMQVLTYSTYWFEAVGPVLLFFPFQTGIVRTIAILGFIIMQLGFGMSLAIGLFPWISAVSMIGLLPSWFWDSVVKPLRKQHPLGLRVYYDEDCDFCTRSVRLIRTFFLIPNLQLIPAQTEPSIAADMTKMNSWITVDSVGERCFGFQGALVLMQRSRVLWPLAFLLNQPAITRIGERAYALIARHRRSACPVTLSQEGDGKPSAFKLSMPSSVLVASLVVYVFLFNVDGYLSADRKIFSERLRAAADILRLDQKWNMFAPSPAKVDGWFVVVGKLRSGDSVDIYGNSDGKAVSWEKPDNVSETYKNDHWWRYLRWVATDKDTGHAINYGRYLCRTWNEKHSNSRRVTELEVYYMLVYTLPNYRPFEPERRLLLNHKCEGEPLNVAAK